MESSGTVVTTPQQKQQQQNNNNNNTSSSSGLAVPTTTSTLEGHLAHPPASSSSSSLRATSPGSGGLGLVGEDPLTRVHASSGGSGGSISHNSNNNSSGGRSFLKSGGSSGGSPSGSNLGNSSSGGGGHQQHHHHTSTLSSLSTHPLSRESRESRGERDSVGGGVNCGGGNTGSGTHSNNNNNSSSANSGVGSGGGNTSTRRTRHRVDAGEPRGCFNTYYNSPRNIFSAPGSGVGSSGLPSNAGVTSSSNFLLGNHASALYGVGGGPDLYFQPMKMLSEFIGNSHPHFNSHHTSPTPPTSNNNNNNNNNNQTNNHNSPTAASQLLLREMLQKKKIGYEDDVNEIARSEREREMGGSSEGESVEGASSLTGPIHNNNNNEEIKINGCKKRKLYQPQRTDFDDDPEEFKEDLDDDVDMHEYKHRDSGDEDDELMLKSPMAPLTRQLLTSERKTIPKNILQRWKETLKSTLMTHINELVDTQFNVLIESIGSSPNQSHAINHGQNLNSRESTQGGQGGREGGRDRDGQAGGHSGNAGERSSNHHLTNNNNNNHGGALQGGRPPSSQPHHHHHQHHHHNTRQQSVTPPPSLPTSNHSVGGGHGAGGGDNLGKNHFNGGGGFLVSDHHEKLSRSLRFRPPYSSALAGLAANNSRDLFDDDGPLSLVVTPKKKRHKVTDTRLTPRAVSRLLNNGSSHSDHYLESTPSPRPNLPSPPSSMQIALPTSVAIPNPSLTESRHLFAPYAPLFSSVRSSLESPPTMVPHPMSMSIPPDYVQQLREITAAQQAQREQAREAAHAATILERERGGSAGSADSIDTNGGSYDIGPGIMYGSGHSSSTLTPMHLRKAKLMFFWVRYPSSAVLKMYFPDIKFNKNNTAQLVKWFSNFREFYYIQMEKYARQALSEGIKVAEDIHVSTDNELYRVLNLHYNRNNHIEVPTNFRYVVEQTLREFFKSIQSGKDSEQSWKKAIYKIIARLDDPVPEYFKSPNFLEQLE